MFSVENSDSKNRNSSAIIMATEIPWVDWKNATHFLIYKEQNKIEESTHSKPYEEV